MTHENPEKPAILIIDDDEQIRRLLKELLGSTADCTTVGSAEDALDILKSINFNLVISDINMGGISGLDLLPRVLEQTPDTVIVMISGQQTIDFAIEAMRAGANDFLRKPVDDIELITRVRNLLELRARQIDLAKANAQLYVLATTYQLTNLKNRRYFIEKLEFEVERACRYERPCSVAIIDADRFKTVNDTYGHDIGDKVLRTLSRILLEELRGVDHVGRLGGDEFAIQFPETDKRSALDVCRRLVSRIRDAKVMTEAKEINFTISMGLTEIVQAGDEADAVVKRADQALYRAKELGRDRCEVA